MKKAMRLLMPIVVAGGLGPLVGGLAFCLFAAVLAVIDPTPGAPISDLFGIFALYIVFAYVLGWPIALLAGLLMSIWMMVRPPSLVAAIAATVAAVGLLWLADAANLMGPVPNLAHGMLALTLGVSAVAAIVCWLLLRPLAARIGP
jgi:hypothetical protein